ncbi:MAG TPA: DUF748 domain-containing protein, partial [Gammaproteobacteria bacterium]|nr:DUF748 domain-containing protein [Gammaproteobacteria bacterium]
MHNIIRARWRLRAPAWLEPRRLPPRTRRALAAAGIVAAAFAAGTLVVAPYLVDRALTRFAAAGPGRSARAERISVNPFTLTVTLRGADFGDPERGAALTADALRINFAFPTLLGGRFALDELEARGARLRLDASKVASSPVFTASERPLAERFAATLAASRPVSIDSVDIDGGTLEIESADPERRLAFDGVRIAGAGLATQGGTGRYSASAGSVRIGRHAGVSMSIEGTLALAESRASGRALVSGLFLESLRPWLDPEIAGKVPSGRVDFAVDYAFPAGADGRSAAAWRLSNGEGRLTDATVVLSPTLAAHGVGADLRLQQADVGGRAVALQRLDVEGGRFELVDSSVSPPATIAATEVSGSIAAAAAPDGSIDVSPIDVSLKGALPDGGSGSLELRVAETASIASRGGARGASSRVEGRASDAPAVRSVALDLHDVPAAVLAPYAERALGRPLAAGRVDFALEGARDDAGLTGTLRAGGRDLEFADARAEPEASALAPSDDGPKPPGLPLDLALALLADDTGRIELTAPLVSDVTEGAAARIPSVAAAALRARIASIAAAPFETLAAAVGRDASALESVEFEPGAAEP